MQIKTLIVESDELIVSQLRSVLSVFPSLRVVERVDTTEQAIAYLHKNAVDLVISNLQPAPAATSGDGAT